MGDRMTQLVRFRSGANSDIAIEVGKPDPYIIYKGQIQEVEHFSHIRLLVKWRTVESTCG